MPTPRLSNTRMGGIPTGRLSGRPSGTPSRPIIDANSFELMTSLIQFIQQNQFSGLLTENPSEHLCNFLEKCDTVKTNGISNDVLRLRLFPFSLRDRAKEWLTNDDPNSYDTWNKLSIAFLHKFFQPGKTAKHEITSFVQHDTESLYEAWERFKELQRQCPDHGVPSYLLILIFYSGVKPELQMSLNVAAGGALDGLAWDKAQALIEEMASNTYHWGHDRHVRGGRFYNDFVQLIINDLSQQSARMSSGGSSSSDPTCQLCGAQGHYATDCSNVSLMEQANALYSMQPFDPFPNTYNLGLVGWSFDPNLDYCNTTPHSKSPGYQTNPQFRQIPLQETNQKSNLELMMEQMLASQSRLTASHDQLSASQGQFMATQELKNIELSNKLSRLQNQENSSHKMLYPN
ncbi:uncharacterized protein LOC141640339 [Silene latifolia]|uniref:uncharacterized protein LOC141640339 n=1 Tax=Silene latifolia TaxID=37657 RepID=UPI003D7736ED